MFTHTITRLVTVDGAASVGGTFQLTAGARADIDEPVAVSTTNLPIAWAFAIAKLKSIIITSDRDLTLKTNSSGAPVNTFVLQAGVPIVWTAADGAAFQDTNGTDVANVTSLFATNASADNVANLQIRALVDPT